MKKIVLSFVLIMLLFSACQVAQPETIETQENTPAVPTNTSTPIPPTETPTPTSIPPTNTPTSTATATIVPTAETKFAESRIYGYEKKGTYSLLIFEFPALNQVFDVTINGVAYACELDAVLPDKLVCTGPNLPERESVTVAFFTDIDASAQPIYQGQFSVPVPYQTPTPIGDNEFWCPLRGTNVTCETEHRWENGVECWVMTCFDACGYYYSYHNCD